VGGAVVLPAFRRACVCDCVCTVCARMRVLTWQVSDVERQLVHSSDIWDEEDAVLSAFSQDLLFG
jgi:hypothetical protein